jgi:hypothetical protein
MSEPGISEITRADDPPADEMAAKEAARAARQRQLDDDYQWGRHDPQVHRKYGGQVIVVHKHQVFGAGRDHDVAYQTARRRADCPSRKHLAYVVIPYFAAALDNEFSWCLKDLEIQKRYGGLVTAIHGRTILGAGNDRERAWRDAQMDANCPAQTEVQFVVIPYILTDHERS